jgi:Ni,Fe-hydrogenase III large subunit
VSFAEAIEEAGIEIKNSLLRDRALAQELER